MAKTFEQFLRTLSQEEQTAVAQATEHLIVEEMTSQLPSSEDTDEMRVEYDFRGATRGRHYKPLQEGYTVQIHKADGTSLVQQYKLEEDTVLLEPDVRAWFPDSDAVNQARRSLIVLMEQMPEKDKATKSRKKTVTPV